METNASERVQIFDVLKYPLLWTLWAQAIEAYSSGVFSRKATLLARIVMLDEWSTCRKQL